MITRRQIEKAIGCKYLKLWYVTDDKYFFFQYDSLYNKNNDPRKYETESVMCAQLNHMKIETWVQLGKDFVTKVETA